MRLAIPGPADAFLKQEGLRRELVEAFAFRHFRLFLAQGLGHCGFAPLRSQIGGNMMKNIACNARNVYTAHER